MRSHITHRNISFLLQRVIIHFILKLNFIQFLYAIDKTKGILTKRLYYCPIKECPKAFKNRNNLKIHIRTHYKIRPFKCSFCSKRFNEKGNLKTHLRIHTGERPYQCKECNKKFKAFGQLKDHILSHTDYKPFQCPYCYKNYSRKGILKQHMYIHSADPNFLVNKNFYENFIDKMKSNSIFVKCLVQKYMINYNIKIRKEKDNNLDEIKDENSILFKNNNKEEEKEKIMESIVPSSNENNYQFNNLIGNIYIKNLINNNFINSYNYNSSNYINNTINNTINNNFNNILSNNLIDNKLINYNVNINYFDNNSFNCLNNFNFDIKKLFLESLPNYNPQEKNESAKLNINLFNKVEKDIKYNNFNFSLNDFVKFNNEDVQKYDIINYENNQIMAEDSNKSSL